VRRGLLVIGVLFAWAAPAHALERGGTEFWPEREHTLDVAAGGWRLRVALDRPDADVPMTADVAGRTIEIPVGLYSGEVFIDHPDAGPYTVKVAGDGTFRLRAKLEDEPRRPAVAVPELPNLQAMPPWDLTFAFPVTNGTTDPPQSLPTPGGRVGCHAEELPAARCLRMAFGVRNTGRGPMDLFLGPGGETEDRLLIQRIYSSDGSATDRDAGMAKFHTSHAHYHHDKAIGLELLKMDGSAAAPVHLKGFAHRNELLREWSMFHPTWDTDGFGLTAGWGDYYEWDRPGNFVDFGLNPDGRYVLRLTADPVGGILESNEADNVGYSVIEVAGEQVTLLESGRGTGPWDRCRILMPQGPAPDLPAGMAQVLRPADCPLDTTDPEPPAPPVASAGVAPVPAFTPQPAAKTRAKPKPKKKCAKRSKAKRCRKAQRRRKGSRKGSEGRDSASRRRAARR
jgi:hypothetical protein